MKKSILFKKLGIILLISQTLVGVPMLAQESILETTVQTETESVTTETSQTVASLESETTSQTVMQEKESSSAIAESSSGNAVAVTTETTNEIQNSDTDGKAVSAENAFSEADYKQATALELATLVREKKVTSEELVKIALAITKRENPTLNAVITLREEAALTEAKALQDTGQPFLGVPLLLKGLGQSLKGESNTNGFGFLRDQVAGGTSTFVKALQNAGFIIIGQTNYPELGWKNISDSKLYGVSVNPWNPNHYSGGSSGGAGASVAAAFVPIASGSDAGGSIRIPASWTGTVGLKPSRGVIIGNSNSAKGQTVHFGLSRTVADTNALFETLLTKKDLPAGHLSQAQPIAYTTESPAGTPVSAEAKEAVAEAVAFLKDQGYTLVEVKHPVDGERLMKNYYTVAAGSAGIADFMARQKLKRPLERNDVELLTWALFQTGKNITSEETTAAWTDIALQAQAMDEFYQQYPILLTPTTAATAPSIDNPLLKPEHAAQMEKIDQLSPAEQKQLIYDQWLTAFTYTPFTQQANLFGHPALSVPTYVSKEGLPLGIQFNSALNEDRTLLQLGALFENNHKINQPHVEEPDKDKEPDASGEPEKDKEPNASGEPDKDKEPNASGEPDKDKEPDASGEPEKDKEPNASGEPEKDKEPDASGEPEKDKEPNASGEPDKGKETKTSEGPIEGKDQNQNQNQNQNPDKSGKTTSESSLANSLNSSANQGTKSTGSTHAFSDKNMIGKQEQLPKKVLPKAGAEVPSTFWIVLGGAFLVTSGTIYIRKTRKQ
ncbi:TPA: 6-aminohexanoate hydrolase [Enterococcus faecalis]|uniref:amidase family protein n=1 Tax=Enterococcus faecalis TaxID=1351 RepID=UPI001570FBC5|nr:amidase family protein [Enterococcus faecalis]EJC3748234.1 6-aminohexanoate hydrolase [Enterococcus faecalis]MDN3154449.1 amidase family protein [Enterococcus faecalis]MDN3174523.1 amidase family protein [Enterococcus faecalis]NSN10062.1 6-aminohexanoate hydrolase [Enterococcus faecalis]HCT4864408.1 6-aminohexanoate hydrolase [Enterococcus faecalis]